ncbi:MAG: class I SAM-dependent methyltransferase, partial [Candidatus Binataceae bacterium]
LKPGGRVACLDVTHPPPALRPLCLAYFNGVVPIIGGIISGDYAAYRYLPNSLKTFPDANRLARMMGEAGFADVAYETFNFGMIAIHTGRKLGDPKV